MLVSLQCYSVALMLVDITSGFQGHLHHYRDPSIVGRSIPLLKTKNSASDVTSISRTALFDRGLVDLEGDPLEDDRRQRSSRLNETTDGQFTSDGKGVRKRFVPPQKKDSGFSSLNPDDQQQREPKRRLVRSQTSFSSSSRALDDETPQPKPSSNGDERKATTSTKAGLNLELRDPKERVLVRHATASSAYGVDDFKGKKKKIIKPWSSGRKKNKQKRNFTGGIARDAYGEELKVELKTEPKKKRLVMARTNSSVGSQDAAKALIGGGSTANSLTAEDIAEEKRINKEYNSNDAVDDNFDVDSHDVTEPNLLQHSPSIANETDDGVRNGPNLIRLSSSIVRQPDSIDNEEPNLVRLSSSIVREPEDDGKCEPNLVRHESSMVIEQKQYVEEELKFYTRSEASEEEEGKHEEQRLVRAVPASQPSPLHKTKLVRPNIVKEQVEEPKLMRPNIVKAKRLQPKLVRPNVFRAKSKGPKLVRAKVEQKKPQESNLVRVKVFPDRMDVGNGPSAHDPPLVPSTTIKMNDFHAEDFMYGAKASTANPTAVPFEVVGDRNAKTFMTKIDTTKEYSENMVGSRSATFAPTSVKPIKSVKDIIPTDNKLIENLMYGAKKTSTSPTAVSVEDSKLGEHIRIPTSSDNNPMDGLMYGANQATLSPTAVPLAITSKKRAVSAGENISKDSDDSIEVGASQSSAPVQTKPKTPAKPQSPVQNAMDDLMYGYQRATSSPTAVKIDTNPTKDVQRETGYSISSIEDSSLRNPSATSFTIYPDGDKRKDINQRRLVRASPPHTNTNVPHSETNNNEKDPVDSNQKRYVKPSTSAMNHVPDWDAADPASTVINPISVKLDKPVINEGRAMSHSIYEIDDRRNKTENEEGKKKKYVQPSTSLMNNTPDWDAAQSPTTTSNPTVISVGLPKLRNEVVKSQSEKHKSDHATENPKKKYVYPSTSQMNNEPDWDAVQPATTSSNPSVVKVDLPKLEKEVKIQSEEKTIDPDTKKLKKKKFVQPSTSLMENAPDWDAVQPATTSSNPSVVNVDLPKLKKEVERQSEGKNDPVTEKPKKKKYVQPSTSLMDNAPDWDDAQSVATTSNPSVVKVDLPKLKKEVKNQSEEKNDPVTEKPKKKKYVQPSTSLMENAPDWDAAQPPTATSNPSVVSANSPKLKKEVNSQSEEKKSDALTEKPAKKKYVQPSTSLMDDAPDWDAALPPTTTSNPSLVNVDLPKLKKVKSQSEEKSNPVTEKPKKKKYIQPSTSLMNNAPDWDAAQPDTTTSNPSLVNVEVPILKKEGKDKTVTEKPKKRKYIQPSTSMMNSAPDWDAVKPAFTTSNPSVVNIDGINKIGKRLVRPFSSSNVKGETSNKARPASVDTPFKYKQVQSIPKENPGGAKPVQDEGTKKKLPAAIAHAAGSSSDGWTPEAHFPSADESNSSDGNVKYSSRNRKRTSQYSTMENYDPDALPRPTGVIPLTVSSSSREKTQLFRAEHSLEPVEDNAESVDATADPLQKPSSSPKASSIRDQEHEDENRSNKKLFLYDGGNSQPKEAWEFTMEGFDTKLDKSSRQGASMREKKLVAYDRKTMTSVTSDVINDSINPPSENIFDDEKGKRSKPNENNKEREEEGRSGRPIQRTRLEEKTVSPFTRNVSSKDNIDIDRETTSFDGKNEDIDPVNDQ